MAVSRAVRDSAARAFEGDFRIVPDGVDLTLFRPAPERRPGPVRVLFEGAGVRRSGLRSLLRALTRLTAEADGLELHICGDDLQARRYEELVPPAFARRVRFHGRCRTSELAALYADADVLCAAAYETESFAAPVVRGMASGAAVLATDIPAHRDLVTDGREGVLVPPRQPRALARELRALVSDDGRRAALAAGGLKAAQRFGWDDASARSSSRPTTRSCAGASATWSRAGARWSCTPTCTCIRSTARTAPCPCATSWPECASWASTSSPSPTTTAWTAAWRASRWPASTACG